MVKEDGSSQGRIQLFNEKMFDPLNPEGDLITPEQLAHAGANMCRYAGNSKFFYSVAEHSILVSNMLEEWGAPVVIQLQGLFHDADEALGLPDLARPIKVKMPEYKKFGEAIQKVVFEKFGLGWPMDPLVALADNSILFLYERPKLMGRVNDEYWQYDGELRKSKWAVREENIIGLLPEKAEYMFNMRYKHLWDKFTNGR